MQKYNLGQYLIKHALKVKIILIVDKNLFAAILISGNFRKFLLNYFLHFDKGLGKVTKHNFYQLLKNSGILDLPKQHQRN